MPGVVLGTGGTRVDKKHIQFRPAWGLRNNQEERGHNHTTEGDVSTLVSAMRDPHVAREGILGRHGRLPGGRCDSFEI